MGKDLTVPVTIAEMQPILEHFAKAAHYSHEAWLHVEATLPLIREVCPEYYEEVAARIVEAFNAHLAIEGQADAMVDSLGLEKQLESGSPRPLVTAPLIGMQ